MREKLKELFEEMDLNEKIAVHNKYCELNHYAEIIVPMSEFDVMNENLFTGLTASEIVIKVQADFDEFELKDNYYYWTDNDDIISFAGEAGFEDVFYKDDVINYIISNQDSLGNDEIAELLEM